MLIILEVIDIYKNQLSCKIFAKGVEQAFILYSILEHSLLYGGYPCNDLRYKVLLVIRSNVVDLDDTFLMI